MTSFWLLRTRISSSFAQVLRQVLCFLICFIFTEILGQKEVLSPFGKENTKGNFINILLAKNIGTKVAHKLLMKLTPVPLIG